MCHHGTCCRLRYRGRPGTGYALALLSGLDRSPGVEPWAGEAHAGSVRGRFRLRQACAVLPCKGGNCLRYPQEALQQHGADWFGQFAPRRPFGKLGGLEKRTSWPWR